MKNRVFWTLGIVVLLLLVISSGQMETSPGTLSLDASITNESGGNLVASNIISDPAVLSSDRTIGNLACKFPSRWQYASDAAPLGDMLLSMWFTALVDDKISISSAQSSDGLTWSNVKEGVLKPGPGWDSIGVETASVIQDSPGKYRLYYSSSRKDHDDFAIGLASSDDGSSWNKVEEPVFLPANSWEMGEPSGVQEPSVIYDSEEDLYKMWYSALGEKDGKQAFRIGYADSLDGINWKRSPEPVLDVGIEGQWDDVLVSHPDVARSRDGYHMLYFGVADWSDEVSFQKGAIGHAYSSDGIEWHRNPKNPVIKPREGSWDAWTVGGPSGVVLGNQVWAWYFGNPRKDAFEGRIGLVRGACE